MKKNTLFLLLLVVLASAKEFTNIYKTKAVCTEVDNTEYCYVTAKEDVFAVMNYQGDAGRILFHGKDYPEYTPIGSATSEQNSKGVSVWRNDYVDNATGKKYVVMYSEDNLWFSSDWNGFIFCNVTKYWPGDKASFKDTYKFKEVYSNKKLETLVKRCIEK